MSGWFACYRTDEARELQERYPFAFLLLFQIAQRAKWKPCGITGLDVNQAFVGDYKKAGIPSEMAYRHAKKVLESNGLATFKGTNKGTVATINNQSVFGISMEEGTTETTDQQRTNNGQGTTNNKDIKKEGNNGFPTDIFEEWNDLPGIPQARTLSEKRKTAIRARMKDQFFAENWRVAMNLIPQIPFLTGSNNRGWKADLDWFLQPDSVAKIIEGKYTQKQPSSEFKTSDFRL